MFDGIKEVTGAKFGGKSTFRGFNFSTSPLCKYMKSQK
jgi:hypothetical protein